MADAKKVTVEITNSKVIIPQSVFESKYHAQVALVGEVLDVYEDVAKKLADNGQASVVTKESPATIKKTQEETEQAERDRRENLLKGDEEPKGKKK